ncbi:MAG: AAA family ATPase [Bacteroidales bacterium]|nr:AAA family ATPase [Bacteroidales bacterium]
MIFKRKIYQQLLDWKARGGATGLLIEGARRVGKSTIAVEFAQNEYKSHILIDFNIAPDSVKNLFSTSLNDLDTFFLVLSTEYGVKLHPRESLIIFDEVQKCPKAREALKYLVQDGRFDYIETGSLISIRENVQDISIPSEEEPLRMYPMDFEEFCWAMGDEQIPEYIRHCYQTLIPLEQGLHHKAMMLFRQYLIVGGMPKPLSAYIENGRDFYAAEREKRQILRLYRADIMKIDAKYRSRVLAIFDQWPSLLAKQDRRVVLRSLEERATYEVYEDTFFWLQDSMIANECFNSTDPNVGLALNQERTYIKCYMADTGLLLTHAFNENELADGELFRELLLKKLSINEGMFFENIIMQMLVAAGHHPYFYVHYNTDKHRNDIEIDFIISNKSKLNYKIYPIEVKSKDRYSTASLHTFVSKFKKRIGCAYVIHPKNLSKEEGILRLPAYMTFCL